MHEIKAYKMLLIKHQNTEESAKYRTLPRGCLGNCLQGQSKEASPRRKISIAALCWYYSCPA